VTGLVILAGILLLMVSLLAGALNLVLRDMSRARLEEHLERQGRAGMVEALYNRRDELIVATATGRTLANIGMGLVVLVVLLQSGWEIGWQTYLASFGIAAGFVFVFGVLLAHVWADYRGERMLVTMAPALLGIGVIFAPLVAAEDLLARGLKRLTGAKSEPQDSIAEIEQDIIDVVSEGEAQGHMGEDEKEMIVSVIELRDQHVAEIMTPRIEIIGVEVHASLDEIRKLIAEEGYSRMPVYEESLDNVLGILYTKDLLTLDPNQPFDLRAIMRRTIFVPDTKTVRDLLHEFKKQKTKIAMVLDEYGGTAGLVTTNDIYEELVGDIGDEEDEEPAAPAIVRIDDSTTEIDARLRVDEFNEEFDQNLPENEGYDTVGGFILSRLGRIPKRGDELLIDSLQITILDADERRINRVRIHIQTEQESEPQEARQE